ncbi:hypothetical protein QUF56_17395 [Ureibacillus composti]|nr:hypothetical protein [Ureibacillus composti]
MKKIIGDITMINIDINKVKSEFVKTILEYSTLINQEIVNGDFIAENVNVSTIRDYGSIIADSSNIYMGTQRTDFAEFRLNDFRRIVSEYQHKIRNLLLQSECVPTREKVIKQMEEMEIKLEIAEYYSVGENVKESHGKSLDKMIHQFEKEYGERLEYIK